MSSSSHFAPTVASTFVKPVVLPPGCARLASKALRDRFIDHCKDDRDRAGRLLQRSDRPAGVGENHVRGRRQHFGNGGVGPFNGVDAPSIVDAKIATDRPSPLLKALQQSRGAGLTLRVTFGVWNQYADATHAIRLLRACGKWPRDSRAAENRDEVAPTLIRLLQILRAGKVAVKL